MNLASGVFKAPKPGVYYFTYSGIKRNNAPNTYVDLKVNGKDIARAHGTDIYGSWTMSLHAIVKLKVGDQISLTLTGGAIHDEYNERYSNFIGFLMEEYLA